MGDNPTGVNDQLSGLSGSVGAAPSGRTFIFHTGTHKTGSTALQSYLALNANRLKEAGIAYAYATGNVVVPGNGQHLFQSIRQGNIEPNHIDNLLTAHLDNCSTAIISSEDFTHFGQIEWQLIAEASQRLRGRVRTITFVRDLAPYYASLHAQLVSDGGTTEAFNVFSARPDIFALVLDSLMCLMQTFQRDSMTVLHYESALGAIDKAFLNSLGLPCDSYDSAPLRKRANRSLTQFEQDIVRRVTESNGTQLARRLSTHLKRRRPQLASHRHFSARFVRQLGTRHASDLDLINNAFFGGESVVQITRHIPVRPNKPELSEAVRNAVYRDVVDWCLDILKNADDDSFLKMGRLLRDIDWNLASNPTLPDDFDPIAYLAHNPDIVRNGIPPFSHYINNGHNEAGRKWKWTN